MPIISSDENEYSPGLANELIQRFNWEFGLYLDTENSDEPSWLVSTSAFNRWFELLQENLELNLGRRLAHAAADSEEFRLQSVQRPSGLFGINKKSLNLINNDWRIRGLGTLKVPSKPFKLSKLDVEVHGRLQSSFSSGLANAAWEWIVKSRHRFRWEDRGKDIAIVHLEEDAIEVTNPKRITPLWKLSPTEISHIQKNPLSKPFELPFGGWDLMGERHVMLHQDFILRFVKNVTTYASECAEVGEIVDWSVFGISETESKVWNAIAKSSCDLFREGGELFMVAEAEHWVDASQTELVDHGLGAVKSSKEIDNHGGVELEFSSIFHPAIVTGVLLGCWSRSEGRDAKARWNKSNSQLSLVICSKSVIASD